MKALVHALARCSVEEVNSPVSARDLRTSLHLACAMGNLAMAQLLIWVCTSIHPSIKMIPN